MYSWINKPSLGPAFDPYLDWQGADGDAFSVDQTRAAQYGEVIDEKVICLIAECSSEPKLLDLEKIDKAIGRVSGSSQFGHTLIGTRFLSLRVDKGFLAAFIKKLPTPLSRVDVSMPLKLASKSAKDIQQFIPPTTARVLLAVVDDGCAFAHAKWRNRILALWVQGHDGSKLSVGRRQVGQAHPQYGWTCLNTYAQTAIARVPARLATLSVGLDEWIELHRDPATGAVDEGECYDDLGIRMMRHSASHGAHVLDTFAGKVAPSARASPLGDDWPTWAVDKKTAANSPITFVQLPRYAVEDTSGRWLGSYLLDALSYVLKQAEDLKVKKVIVNASYGHTTGPHDGSSIVEQAIAHLCQRYNGKDHEGKHWPKLSLVLSAGNSFKSRASSTMNLGSARTKSSAVELCWRVLPDGLRPSFLEIWFPEGTKESDFEISIQMPNEGKAYPMRQGVNTWTGSSVPTARVSAWCVFKRTSGAQGGLEKLSALIALAPTDRALQTGASAPSGDWKITVENKSSGKVSIHAYVARATAHMHSRRTGTLSYLVDAQYEPERFLREQIDDNVSSSSCVHRRGTLNGIATGGGTCVISGYRMIDKEKKVIVASSVHSRSASAGSTRDGRAGISLSFPSDVSDALPGMRSAGNRSGVTFRMAGTSVATPQASRTLANGGLMTGAKSNDPKLLGYWLADQP